MSKEEQIEAMIEAVREIEQSEHLENYKSEKAMRADAVKSIMNRLKEVTEDDTKKA